MSHEVNRLFDAAGLPLARQLREMLDEHPVHRTERRGCGYTQATRFLATYVNQPADPFSTGDLGVFEDWPQRDTRTLASILHGRGWHRGWRNLDEASPAILATLGNGDVRDALLALAPTLDRIAAQAVLPESRLLIAMIAQVLSRRAPPAADVPGMPAKPAIGSCSQAEEFFLEIAHARIRRRGSVNVIVAPSGEPLLLEKMNLGESHSAIVVSPIRINGVWIPPGGLCALEHVAGGCAGEPTSHGTRLPLADIARARFLRLTTLTLPPQDRQRAFSAQVEAQVRARMLSPTTTTLAELQGFALRQSHERAC